MSLERAILGLLIESPMHGYALKKKLAPALSRRGLPNDGVFYPLLSRLERDGLVSKKIVEIEGRPNRHILSITPRGKQAFRRWLEGDDDEADEVTYDFFLGSPFITKCMFFDRLEPSEVAQKIDRQRQATQAKLGELARIRQKLVDRGVNRFRIAILDLGVAQQRARLRWLGQLARRTRTEKETVR